MEEDNVYSPLHNEQHLPGSVYCAHLAKRGVEAGTQRTEENALLATPQTDQWLSTYCYSTSYLEFLFVSRNDFWHQKYYRWNNLTS